MARPVISADYCAQGQVTLKAKEKVMSMSGDGFSITSVQDGSMWFRVDNKLMSLREKRVLMDAHGRPACGLMKKFPSLTPTWVITRGADFEQPIATIKQKLLSLKPTINVYLADDSDKEADFKCKGNFRAKKFEVLAVQGGQEVEIAKIRKESRFSSGTAFLKAAMTEADAYFIEAQPGADMAFLTALCIAVDEIFQDAQK